jgi:CelD/BcsL family acetyltransferase involved in cellulose biosynthesis
MPVETKLIEDMSAFAQLEPFWNQLVAKSIINTCHSTFEWLFTWWRHFGTGRHLFVVAAYEHGILVGLAPLYIGNGINEPTDLHFLGQGLSDYADFIVPTDRPDVVEALVSALFESHESWDGLDLEEMPSTSPSRACLDAAINGGGATAAWQETVRCPYLPITGTWEAFYAAIGKGFRHEVRNKLNRCRDKGLHFAYFDRRAADDAFVDEVVALSSERRSADGHRSPFLNHPDCEFLRDVLPLMGRRNMLRIGELRSRYALLAFMLGFQWQGVASTWNTQYDPRLTEYSLGRIVLVSFAEQVFRDGCRELDFMRGEEPYKFQWTSLTRTNLALRSPQVRRLLLTPAGVESPSCEAGA